jgi:hypothetical protein
LGRAGLSNGYNGGGFSSGGNYGGFSEDLLNQTFHFHNPFDIFEQFMRHFGMEDEFGESKFSSKKLNYVRMTSTRACIRCFLLIF